MAQMKRYWTAQPSLGDLAGLKRCTLEINLPVVVLIQLAFKWGQEWPALGRAATKDEKATGSIPWMKLIGVYLKNKNKILSSDYNLTSRVNNDETHSNNSIDNAATAPLQSKTKL